MPSSIPGYEYDIFISYRQKDNLYDNWVTEFIENLRKELQATFKEDIFIYTDENKYDGLTEIHHVEESLSSRLKCLIFIPILSLTYGDPNSYAWRNEFLVFKKFAAEDRFGLKVKLANGNVVSRIVPVRIHELDLPDKTFFEKEMGSPLRSIDFIFRAPGVNRPLRAREDHPHDNQEKTYYRDQINKVANLIKEIILSLKFPDQAGTWTGVGSLETPTRVQFTRRKKIATISAIAISAMALLFYYLNPGNSTNAGPAEDGRVAMAVLPFKAIGGSEESQYLAQGVTEVLLSNLTIFPELKIKSGPSVEKYRDNPKSIPDMARELNVVYILDGSAQKFGDDIRVVVQLIDTRTDENVWSQNFVRKFKNLFEIQNQISEAVAKSLKARLTPAIVSRINRPPTSDFEAYDMFLRAKQLSKQYKATQDPHDLSTAIALLSQAVKKDSRFALAYAWLAGLKAIRDLNDLSIKAVQDSILLLGNRAVELDSTVVEGYIVLSLVYNYLLDNSNALRFTYRALQTESTDSVTSVDLMKRLAAIYSRVGDVDQAIFLYDQLLKLDSGNAELLRLKFYPLASGRQPEQVLALAEKFRQVAPADDFGDVIQTHVWTVRRNYAELEQIYRRHREMTPDDMDLLTPYILVYATALRKNGKPDEALNLVDQFEKTLDAADAYHRAQLLMYKGRNDEGLRLLGPVALGWYNLTLCEINPLFEPVVHDSRFNSFVKRNKDRIGDQRDRILQFENNGYLPRPEEFFQRYSRILPL